MRSDDVEEDEERANWTMEEVATTGLMLLFLTHLYVPIVEPVQNSLFAAASDDQTAIGQVIVLSVWLVAGLLILNYMKKRRIP